MSCALQHGTRCRISVARLDGRVQVLGSWKVRSNEHARVAFRLTMKVGRTPRAQDTVLLLPES